MSQLSIKEIMEDEEGYVYSIIRKELIPFKRERIKNSDNEYYADAKFMGD